MFEVVEKVIFNEGGYAQLKKEIEAQIEWLKEASVEEIVEGHYGLKRTQVLTDKWVTESYGLLLACGGPNIWLSTEGIMEGAWGGNYIRVKITDREVLEKLKEVFNYLDSLE